MEDFDDDNSGLETSDNNDTLIYDELLLTTKSHALRQVIIDFQAGLLTYADTSLFCRMRNQDFNDWIISQNPVFNDNIFKNNQE